MTWELYTGLDFVAPLDVYQQANLNGEDVSTATITASLLASDGTTELVNDTAQSSGTTGASWTTGRVVVVIPLASTGGAGVIAVIGSTCYIGVKITSGGLTTALGLFPVTIKRGF